VIKAGPAPLALWRAVKEVRGASKDVGPIAVDGDRALVTLLAKELRAGGEASSVTEGRSAGRSPAALVWIGAADETALREAGRARTPIVGVTAGESLPYVLDTELVRLPPGQGLPIEQIARKLARALGDDGAILAAKLPVLRDPVVDELIASAARKNGLLGAAVFVPGVDLPILTFNELRLVLRIALAYGREIDTSLWPEILGIVGASFGWRRLARELLDFVPVAGWAIKGGIAYGGTKAIGEAARLRFGSSPIASS
jgi:uncharacterized protein (DUF697 family)